MEGLGKRLPYLLFIALLNSSCVYHELPGPIDCSKETIDLTIISQMDLTNCLNDDGSFEVYASGKNDTFYEYSINQIDYQQTGLFTNLISGNYIASVRNKNGCTGTISISLNNFMSDLTAVVNTLPDSECFSDNGQATVDISGGLPPYTLFLENHGVAEAELFKNLGAGLYNLRIADSAFCSFVVAFEIPRAPTGINYNNEIKPIIDTRCAKSGCHIAGTGRVDFTIFGNVKENAALIKLYTQTLRMPRDGVLSKEEIQKIACWVDDGALNN